MSKDVLSLPIEIDSLPAGLSVDEAGIRAFRHGGEQGARAAEDLGDSVSLHEIVALAWQVPTENPVIEVLKHGNPDEFILGAAVHAYKSRKGKA